MKFSTVTLSRKTFSIMTLSETTFSIMSNTKMTLNIMTISIAMKIVHYTDKKTLRM